MTQILAAHIGSYPRIGDLKDHQRHRRGLAYFLTKEISAHAFRDVVQSVVQEAVSEQVEAGLDEITDGLISWLDPVSQIVSKCAGLKTGGLRRYFGTSFHYRVPVFTGKSRRKEPIILEEVRFAKSITPRPVRAVLTGPMTLGELSESETKLYGKTPARIQAFAEILEEEIAALVKEGTATIQIDEPSLLWHPEHLPLAKKIFERFLKAAQPSTLFLASSFMPPDPKIEILFEIPSSGVQIDLTQNTKERLAKIDRFRPLTNLGLGLINASNTRPDLLDPIINTVAPWLERNIPDNCYVTPSCGLELVPRDVAQAKLRAVVRLKMDLAKRLSLPVVHG
jgi:5-methyltetrahydropteroyltriglutamate--homocysteine methyltransferase